MIFTLLFAPTPIAFHGILEESTSPGPHGVATDPGADYSPRDHVRTPEGNAPMSNAQLETAIEAAWDARDTITPATTGETREAIEDTLNALDSGSLRVAERGEDGTWHVNQWAKKAVLLGFRLKDMEMQGGSAQGGSWWDKVDSKWATWGENEWGAAGFRAVPNCVVRKSAYIAPGVVLMPSFVNLGAYVDERHHGRHLGHRRVLRADRQERAPVGRRRHRRRAGADAGGPHHHRGQLLHRRALRGGRGLHRARGLRPRHGRLYRPVDQDRRPGETGEVMYGEVPAGSVVVAGSMPSKNGVNLYCAVIVKRVDEKTRSKTSINELLRD
jgi:2,3,4,5-tetrahydropyridine-2-carboxylate N-succinyltransferase